MRTLLLLLALSTAAAAPAEAQSFLAPGDLDHVLGAALALTMDTADALEGVIPISTGAALADPAGLRRAQRRALHAALTANRAQSYLRLYVVHLGEHREATDEPPPQWAALIEMLEDVPVLAEELVTVPAERLGPQPFDAAAARDRLHALAIRLRAMATVVGEAPGRYED